MDNKLAIIRIINGAPLDKVVKPISNVPYLRYMSGSEITHSIFRMLKSSGKLEYDDWSETPENLAVRERNKSVEREYTPLSSAYNSMTLWTINGPMADEVAENGTAFAGNTYTDRNCAIVDYLMPHIDQCVSISPIDFAIRGNTPLSSDGRILVTKKYFDSLSEENKQRILSDKQFEVKEGPITEAVNETLTSMGIAPEEMSLSRDDEGFKPSGTAEGVKAEIEKLSNEYGIANVRHANILQGQFDPNRKLDFAKQEFKNMLCVESFFERTFIDYMAKNMGLDASTVADCMYMPSSEVYIEQLFDEVKEKGIDNFKQVVTSYNKSLIELKRTGKLPTPQKIVDVMATKEQGDYSAEQQISNELININSMEM